MASRQLLLTTILAILSVLVPTTCAAASATTKWPLVGWSTFRNCDFHLLRPGDYTYMSSSYDRTNKNDDGFEGTYSCLYNASIAGATRCVIAEDSGPGQVSDIWFTYRNDSVAPVGDVRIELDGRVVLQADVQDLVDGKLGAPFVWPLVGNTNDTSGGNVIKVPMPYGESMRVSTSHNPHFYHLMYRSFPEGTEVRTFDPEEDVGDVVEAFRRFGVEDPKNVESKDWRAGGWRSHGWKSRGWGADDWHGKQQVRSGKSSEALEIEGSGRIDEVQIRIPEILGAKVVSDDGRAFGEGGSSSFSVRVDGSSSRCRLTRRLDKSIGHQRASVTVDGTDAEEWADSGASEDATWYDQVLELDPHLTKGKERIEVKNTFISSDLDFNEFFYAAHCLPHQERDWQLTDLLNVGWNNQHDEEAHGYAIVGQTWRGLRSMYSYAGERGKQASASIDALNDVQIHMEFDGKETVSQPLGSFFNVALGKNDVRSLLLSVDSMVDNGAFTSWFPMPFAHSFKLSLTRANSSDPIPGTARIKYHHTPLPPQDEWGYFTTHHRRAETAPGELWSFLSTTGPGTIYGVTHAIRSTIVPPANPLGFLEGDLQTWYNRTTPGAFASAALLGTGTEDFYESGWYFADAEAPPHGEIAVPYAMPLGGLTGSLYHELGCVGRCVSPMRLMVGESLAFGPEGISFDIEHGDVGNNVQAEYETTAFYYAP